MAGSLEYNGTGRQTDRQANRQAGWLTGRQPIMLMGRELDRHADLQTDR